MESSTVVTHDWAAEVERLNGITDAVDLLTEVFRTFGKRAAIGTSGQLSGVTLVDLAYRTGLPFRAFAVDTLRLHPSTYKLWDDLQKRYGFELEIFRPDPEHVDKMVRQHGEYLFFDSQSKQEYCCEVRKVRPNDRALASLDVWITGLRRDQSSARKTTPRCTMVEEGGRSILKVAPLVEWSEEDVWNYIREFDVPYDAMFDPLPNGARYPSLGCIICTTPILPHEPLRAGRWRWFNAKGDDAKECGIHVR
ncbi:MAG: phosphoadenylyl-sulfate reductase [Myxococcales bacterium]|nr:phosphoadenylyl-sulfate reductase [Myxococcales bacterium]